MIFQSCGVFSFMLLSNNPMFCMIIFTPQMWSNALKNAQLLRQAAQQSAFFSVGKRPPERPPEAQEGRQSGSPLIVFLYFSSRLNKPKKQKGFIKARPLSISWNLRGLSECIVPLFSFPLNASRRKHEDKMLQQLLPGCVFFWQNKFENTNIQRLRTKAAMIGLHSMMYQ